MIRPQRLAAGVLLAAALLTGCRSTVPAVPTEVAPPPPASPTLPPPASPTVEEFPTALPATATVEEIPPGADQPAIEPGPGTVVPGLEPTTEAAMLPAGADQPAIEPGPGTPIPTPVATGEVVAETAPATTLAPELEKVVREHVNAHFPTQNYTLSDVAIEETTVRLKITPDDAAIASAYVFVRADTSGYSIIWGPVAKLTAEDANKFGIPTALAVP